MYSELKNQINKIDHLLKIEDILLYTTLIINNSNPQKDEIVELYDSLEDLLN